MLTLVFFSQQLLGRQEPRLRRPQDPRRLQWWFRWRQRWWCLPRFSPRQASPGHVRAHVERHRVLRPEPVAHRRLRPLHLLHGSRVSVVPIQTRHAWTQRTPANERFFPVALLLTVTTSSAGRTTPSRRPWTRAATSTTTAPEPASTTSLPRSTTLAPFPSRPPSPSTAVSFCHSPRRYCFFFPENGRLTIIFFTNHRAPGSPSWRLHCQGISEPTLYHSLLTRFSSHRNLLLPAYLFKVLVISLPRALFFLQEHKGRKKGGKEGEG